MPLPASEMEFKYARSVSRDAMNCMKVIIALICPLRIVGYKISFSESRLSTIVPKLIFNLWAWIYPEIIEFYFFHRIIVK